MSDARLVILIVTYGNRTELLRATTASALADPDTHLVIVSNGSSTMTRSLLEELDTSHPGRLTTVALPANVGSARGFSVGLSEAYSSGAPILILDDDNPVGIDVLQALHRIEQSLGPEDRTVFALFRPINAAQSSVIAGVPADWVYRELTPGAFHGFDLLTTIAQRRRRKPPARHDHRTRFPVGATGQETIEVPVTMWGGTYLPRAAAQLRVLPDEDLVLYGDDNDFSRRLRAAGARILLLPNLKIEDADAWRPQQRNGRWRSLFPSTFQTKEDERWRLEYLFRNQAYLSAVQARGSARDRLRLLLNAIIRIGGVALIGLLAGRPRLATALTRASIAGLRGRLGETYPLPR